MSNGPIEARLEGEPDGLQLVSVLRVRPNVAYVAYGMANLHAPRLLRVLSTLGDHEPLGDHQVAVELLVDQQTLVDDVEPIGGGLLLQKH